MEQGGDPAGTALLPRSLVGCRDVTLWFHLLCAWLKWRFLESALT